MTVHFYFFQDLPGSFQFQRLSVTPGGRLNTTSGPTTMDIFPFTDTENYSNKLNGSNKVFMHQDQPQISGNILIWAVKICSSFWANSCSHSCFLQLCWPISHLQVLQCVFSTQTMATCTHAHLAKEGQVASIPGMEKKSRMCVNQRSGSGTFPPPPWQMSRALVFQECQGHAKRWWQCHFSSE